MYCRVLWTGWSLTARVGVAATAAQTSPKCRCILLQLLLLYCHCGTANAVMSVLYC